MPRTALGAAAAGEARARAAAALAIPDAPALEPEEAALVLAPLSAEQTEDVTGCG